MKIKPILLFFAVIFLLAGCGQKQTEQSFTLLDHAGNEVIIPQDKPTVFFFITTYT